jgi:ribosomal protein S18 acetylase RimI-like enzyme
MENLIIRPAKKKDIPAIDSLSEEMHRSLGKMVGLKFTKKDLEDERIAPSELGGVIIAENIRTNEVIGYISFSKKPEEDEWYGKHIYLYEIGVTTHSRGKGIGEKMMEHFIKMCKEKGFNIKVDTLITNENTIRFYKKFGFKPLMVYFVLDNNKRLKI